MSILKTERLAMIRSPLPFTASCWAALVTAWICLAGFASGQEASVSAPFNFEEASRHVPKPREIWPLVAKHTIPLDFKILSDEVVPSDTDPQVRLRKVTAHFYSQELAGKKWGHPCVILMPEDNRRNLSPARKGIKAVVGGHSKRGRSATVAAAMDARVASVIIMGNEGIYSTNSVESHLSFHHAFFQDQVNVPVFHLGATNEDGYKMFNVNVLQARLKQPMTIEMIPNYCHSNFSVLIVEDEPFLGRGD
jgi:hypothetical protein